MDQITICMGKESLEVMNEFPLSSVQYFSIFQHIAVVLCPAAFSVTNTSLMFQKSFDKPTVTAQYQTDGQSQQLAGEHSESFSVCISFKISIALRSWWIPKQS